MTREACIGPRCEHQAVVGSQQERRRHASERPEPRDQRLLERRHRRRCPAASRELPAEQFACVTVNADVKLTRVAEVKLTHLSDDVLQRPRPEEEVDQLAERQRPRRAAGALRRERVAVVLIDDPVEDPVCACR